MLIVAAFIASLLTSNIIAVRIVSFGEAPLIGDVIVTSAIIIFPLSYIVGDVLTEVYGYAAARRVIWAGFAANLLMVIAIYAGGLIPEASDWEDQASYDAILGFTGRLLIASFIAYVIGSFTNAYILARLKIRTKGRMPVASHHLINHRRAGARHILLHVYRVPRRPRYRRCLAHLLHGVAPEGAV